MDPALKAPVARSAASVIPLRDALWGLLFMALGLGCAISLAYIHIMDWDAWARITLPNPDFEGGLSYGTGFGIVLYLLIYCSVSLVVNALLLGLRLRTAPWILGAVYAPFAFHGFYLVMVLIGAILG